jgi:NAD(P)-dependent dehydrogenase (short-subunit alcohol dehydrogenase family)
MFYRLIKIQRKMSVKKMNNLSEKVVFLTGAAGLLGTQYATALSSVGANVVLADINYNKCKKIEKELKEKNNVSPFSIKMDISNKKSIDNAIAKVMKKFSKIDVLVNNAVFPETQKERSIQFEKFPLELWNKIFAVNVTGVFLCNQKIGSIMVKQKKGSIINISSMYGIVAADQRIYGNSGLNSTAAYAVTKSSLFNFTRYLASYWRNTGVRINTLTLGGVENNQDPKFIQKYSEKTMIGRMAKKNEFTGALIFLASDASSYMTGSNMVVDGGWTAW